MPADVALDLLRALAHPARLEIFRILLQHEPKLLTAEEVALRLSSRETRVTVHLSWLSRAGLICATDGQRERRYRACRHALPDFMAFLSTHNAGLRSEQWTELDATNDDLCIPA